MEELMKKIKEKLNQAGRSIKTATMPDGLLLIDEMICARQTLSAAYNMLIDAVQMAAVQAPLSIGLPRWKCHKVVEAAKIVRIDAAGPNHETYLVVAADKWAGTVFLSEEFLNKHNPQPGGYYVRDEDGYESYSPAEAFESGYTRMNDEALLRYQGDGYFGEVPEVLRGVKSDFMTATQAAIAQGAIEREKRRKKATAFSRIDLLPVRYFDESIPLLAARTKINELVEAVNEIWEVLASLKPKGETEFAVEMSEKQRQANEAARRYSREGRI